MIQRFLFSLIFVLPPFAAAGWVVGNGGNAIVCQPSGLNDLAGTYSLDYVLTRDNLPYHLVITATWRQSIERIQKRVSNLRPGWAPALDDFVDTLFNETDLRKDRLWEQAAFGLVRLDDQNIVEAVPENCKVGGHVDVIQAVIRQDPRFSGSRQIVYKYNPETVDLLSVQDPVQLSFLLIHEWLWDVSDDVAANRRLNLLLHSQEIETMTSVEFEATLKAWGF